MSITFTCTIFSIGVLHLLSILTVVEVKSSEILMWSDITLEDDSYIYFSALSVKIKKKAKLN